MTVAPSPYDLIRAIQDQQRATDRLVQMLAGMLDKSAPEPLLSSQPELVPALARLPVPRRIRRERAPAAVEIDGRVVRTTERRAKVLDAIANGPKTASELARMGCAPTVAAVRAAVVDINADLQRAGVTRRVRTIERLHPTGKRGGSHSARYGLVDPDAAAGLSPAVQSEAAGGARPQKGSGASAAGGGAPGITAQPDQFVTSSGAGEGVCPPIDPAPAADEPKNPSGYRDSPLEPAPVSASPPARPDAKASRSRDVGAAPAVSDERPPQPIQPAPLRPEKLAAVDLLRSCVYGPGGHAFVSSRAARLLQVLRHGDLFGVDFVTKQARVPSATDSRHALRVEEATLRAIGLEVWTDKVNIRLREVA